MFLAEGPDQIEKIRSISSIFESRDLRRFFSDTKTPLKDTCKPSKLIIRILRYILTARESILGLVFLVVPHVLT